MSERDALIHNTAKLIAGLAVPVSMSVPIGVARAAWTELHSQLVGFGWSTADDYERAIRRVLDGEPDDPPEVDPEAAEAQRAAETYADAADEMRALEAEGWQIP